MSNYIGQDIILIIKSLISVNLQAMSSTGEYKFSPEGSLGVWSPPSLLSRHYVLSSKRPARAWLVLLKLQRRKRRTRPWKTTLWPRVLLMGLFFCTPPCREISSQCLGKESGWCQRTNFATEGGLTGRPQQNNHT